jgi:hypothetical protein
VLQVADEGKFLSTGHNRLNHEHSPVPAVPPWGTAALMTALFCKQVTLLP